MAFMLQTDFFCIFPSLAKLLVHSESDVLVGGAHIDSAALLATHNPQQVSPPNQHPLASLFSPAVDPVRGSWKKLQSVIQDASLYNAIRNPDNSSNLLEGMDGKGHRALLEVHKFRPHMVQYLDDHDLNVPGERSSHNALPMGQASGVRLIYEYLYGSMAGLASIFKHAT